MLTSRGEWTPRPLPSSLQNFSPEQPLDSSGAALLELDRDCPASSASGGCMEEEESAPPAPPLAVGCEGWADLVRVTRQRPLRANPLKLLGEEAGGDG